VSDIIGEISAASTEQSSGVAQVGQAVSQMDEATQQNAALVEESAAAAESLKQQAEQLVQAVSVFKLSPNAARAEIRRPHQPTNAGLERRKGSRVLPVLREPVSSPSSLSAPATGGGASSFEPRASLPASPSKPASGSDDWETF
jgi:methyl-accepting chemotaxis protein